MLNNSTTQLHDYCPLVVLYKSETLWVAGVAIVDDQDEEVDTIRVSRRSKHDALNGLRTLLMGMGVVCFHKSVVIDDPEDGLKLPRKPTGTPDFCIVRYGHGYLKSQGPCDPVTPVLCMDPNEATHYSFSEADDAIELMSKSPSPVAIPFEIGIIPVFVQDKVDNEGSVQLIDCWEEWIGFVDPVGFYSEKQLCPTQTNLVAVCAG